MLVSEPDYRAPVAAAAPVHDCRPAPPPPRKANAARKGKVYDFASIDVVPVRRGPVITERPYVAYDRTLDAARAHLAHRSDAVTACWQWASARGAKETMLAVELTQETTGSTSGVVVTSVDGGDDVLIACVQEMLTSPGRATPRARPTRVFAQLVFNNDQPAGPKPPARPKAPRIRAQAGALVCPPPGPLDEIHLPTLVVTNFDAARAPKDSLVPDLRIVCRHPEHEINKTQIRVALRSQIGALNACYADAVQRTPTLAGDIGAKLVFAPSGIGHQIQVAGVGDDVLHACFTAALAALWVHPSSERHPPEIEVNLAFSLAPPKTSANPSDLLQSGDIDGAVAIWSELLRAPHRPLDGCQAHAEILRAMTFAAPWLDDERVHAAIANLARSALALPVEQGRACVAGVELPLKLFVQLQGDPTPPSDSPMRHIERYEAVLPLAGLLAWGSRLRWHHAHRLLRTSRADEGEELLAELAHDPVIGADVSEWLNRRAARPEMLHDICDY